MKFRIYKSNEQYSKQFREWHDFYVLFPIIIDGEIICFETVERMKYAVVRESPIWIYRLKNTGVK